MRPSEYLSLDRICPCIHSSSKEELLLQISQHLALAAPQHTAQDIYATLMAREALGSTGIEDGIAIPHGRLTALQTPLLAFTSTTAPIDFGAIDELPSDLFFVLLAPLSKSSTHLAILASLSQLFHQPEFSQQLRYCKTAEAVMHCIQRWEDTLLC